jgi:PqqD family protein of HPr-rel-A system
MQPLADRWAAYSDASGETLLLNTEAAAVLELLADGQMTASAICRCLAQDADMPIHSVAKAMCDVWSQLLEAGLIRTCQTPPNTPG